jgi:NAD(P)-dependent dehydrogenase (short-subunit alcohol dehydrogenase family)
MTDMAEAAFELSEDPAAAQQDALARHAAGRFGKPSDIAKMAVWLACDDSQFATGQCFTIDGGLTAASPINTGLF